MGGHGPPHPYTCLRPCQQPAWKARMILATRTYTITILKQQNLCLFPKHYCKKYPANHGVGQHAIPFKGFNGVLCLKLNMSCLNKGKPAARGGARNFCLRGPSVTLIYLSRQLPRTYIYTYARFFIIYTHFLFDKLYIYTQPKKKKKF